MSARSFSTLPAMTRMNSVTHCAMRLASLRTHLPHRERTVTTPLPHRGQWTADVLSRLPEDKHLCEVIDGELHVIYKNEYSHSLALWSLAMIVAPFAWGVNFDFILGPKPFRFSDRSQVQPDVMVLPRWRNHPSHFSAEATGPELIVEVPTPYTREVDRGVKQRLYAASDVFAYWVIDYLRREVVVCGANDRRPRSQTTTRRWQPRRSDRELTIDMVAYFDAIPEVGSSRAGP
jgi:Putative restriction endonuclease